MRLQLLQVAVFTDPNVANLLPMKMVRRFTDSVSYHLT